MPSPIETINEGLRKTKIRNKIEKKEFMLSKNEKYNPDKWPDNYNRELRQGREAFQIEQDQTGRNRPRGTNDSFPNNRLAGPKVGAKLGAVGAAAGVLDTASEIDNIRKGKSDILERTGIYKRPKEL